MPTCRTEHRHRRLLAGTGGCQTDLGRGDPLAADAMGVALRNQGRTADGCRPPAHNKRSNIVGTEVALALGVICALFAGSRGGWWRRSAIRDTRVESSIDTNAGISGGGVVTTPESVLDEACRRAVDAAVVDPEVALGEDGLLDRFVSGRHEARQDALSERSAERIAALDGTIAAAEDD